MAWVCVVCDDSFCGLHTRVDMYIWYFCLCFVVCSGVFVCLLFLFVIVGFCLFVFNGLMFIFLLMFILRSVSTFVSVLGCLLLFALYDVFFQYLPLLRLWITACLLDCFWLWSLLRPWLASLFLLEICKTLNSNHTHIYIYTYIYKG